MHATLTRTSSSTRALAGYRIAVLAADGVDRRELDALMRELDRAGATTVVVGAHPWPVRSVVDGAAMGEVAIDIRVTAVDPCGLDALVVPGGVWGADALRADPHCIVLARAVAELGRPVLTVGHAAWLLAEAGLSEGVELTGAVAARLDLENAGARWRGDSVVRDGLIVTARDADAVPAAARSLRDAVLASRARALAG
jgi:protease I